MSNPITSFFSNLFPNTDDVLAGAGPAFRSWMSTVHTQGGGATVWPFSSGMYGDHYGQPAAKYDIDTYIGLVDSYVIGPSQVQQLTTNSQYAYVLAPLDAIAAAPPVANWAARLEAQSFNAMDNVADDLGLPSLGMTELVICGGIVVLALLFKHGGDGWTDRD